MTYFILTIIYFDTQSISTRRDSIKKNVTLTQSYIFNVNMLKALIEPLNLTVSIAYYLN